MDSRLRRWEWWERQREPWKRRHGRGWVWDLSSMVAARCESVESLGWSREVVVPSSWWRWIMEWNERGGSEREKGGGEEKGGEGGREQERWRGQGGRKEGGVKEWRCEREMVGLGPSWSSDFSVVLRLMPLVVIAMVLDKRWRWRTPCGCCSVVLSKREEKKPEKGRGGVKGGWWEAFARESSEK